MTKKNTFQSLPAHHTVAAENEDEGALEQADALPLRFFTITYTAAAPAGLPPIVVVTDLAELHAPERLIEFYFQTPGHEPRTVLVLKREHVDEIREVAPPISAV